MNWKDIKGFEDLYQISDTGMIKSKPKCYKTGKNGRITFTSGETIMKQHLNKGYYFVRLCKEGKTSLHRVHRLVAEAFIDKEINKPFINHINGDRSDNRVENLEWCDQRQNVIHAYQIGLNKGRGGRSIVMKDMNNKVIKPYNKISDAVLDGFRHDCIVACCRGKHKEHKGFKWSYSEAQ